MHDIVQKKLRRGTIMIYGTVALALMQSIYLEIITSDYAHQMASPYFFIEIVVLVVMIAAGLKNKWTRIILSVLMLCEVVLFLQDSPVSPDELLMVIIFCLRAYVIIGLFGRTINNHFKTVG